MSYTAPSVASSGWTFAQFQAGGVSGLLERLIAANSAVTSAPSNPTLSATGGGSTGGNLAAGTYYVKVTETNGLGETTPSGEVSVAISAGNIPQVTFASLKSGNVARNVYVGSAAGKERLYATGITASTYNLSAAMPTNSLASSAPPAANTAGLASVGEPRKTSFLRGAEKGNLQDIFLFLRTLASDFNSGRPIDYQEVRRKVSDAHAPVAILNQLLTEVGTLIDANPGTVKGTQDGAGVATTSRVWP